MSWWAALAQVFDVPAPEPREDIAVEQIVYRFTADTSGKCMDCEKSYAVGDVLVGLHGEYRRVICPACFDEREAA